MHCVARCAVLNGTSPYCTLSHGSIVGRNAVQYYAFFGCVAEYGDYGLKTLCN